MDYTQLIKESRETVRENFCRICDEAHTEQLCRAVEDLQESFDEVKDFAIIGAAIRASFYLQPSRDGTVSDALALKTLQTVPRLIEGASSTTGAIAYKGILLAIECLTSSDGQTARVARALSALQYGISWTKEPSPGATRQEDT